MTTTTTTATTGAARFMAAISRNAAARAMYSPEDLTRRDEAGRILDMYKAGIMTQDDAIEAITGIKTITAKADAAAENAAVTTYDSVTSVQIDDNTRIEWRTYDDRIAIIFSDKPDEEIRDRLKAERFGWSRRQCAWLRRMTEESERAAERALGLDYYALDAMKTAAEEQADTNSSADEAARAAEPDAEAEAATADKSTREKQAVPISTREKAHAEAIRKGLTGDACDPCDWEIGLIADPDLTRAIRDEIKSVTYKAIINGRTVTADNAAIEYTGRHGQAVRLSDVVAGLSSVRRLYAVIQTATRQGGEDIARAEAALSIMQGAEFSTRKDAEAWTVRHNGKAVIVSDIPNSYGHRDPYAYATEDAGEAARDRFDEAIQMVDEARIRVHERQQAANAAGLSVEEYVAARLDAAKEAYTQSLIRSGGRIDDCTEERREVYAAARECGKIGSFAACSCEAEAKRARESGNPEAAQYAPEKANEKDATTSRSDTREEAAAEVAGMPVAEFSRMVSTEYTKMYNSGRIDEKAVDEHDRLSKDHDSDYFKALIALDKYRQDYISSDREAAAFYKAYKKAVKAQKQAKKAAKQAQETTTPEAAQDAPGEEIIAGTGMTADQFWADFQAEYKDRANVARGSTFRSREWEILDRASRYAYDDQTLFFQAVRQIEKYAGYEAGELFWYNLDDVTTTAMYATWIRNTPDGMAQAIERMGEFCRSISGYTQERLEEIIKERADLLRKSIAE